jgi:hypothetical protein
MIEFLPRKSDKMKDNDYFNKRLFVIIVIFICYFYLGIFDSSIEIISVLKSCLAS